MSSSAVRAKAKPDLCIVDSHPAEHDCRRIHVDFHVELQLGDTKFAMLATEMCGAGMTLSGRAQASVGDKVSLRVFFPGRQRPMDAYGTITQTNASHLGCEFVAVNSYEQQFLDDFVTACARRQELRKQQGCEHHSPARSNN